MVAPYSSDAYTKALAKKYSVALSKKLEGAPSTTGTYASQPMPAFDMTQPPTELPKSRAETPTNTVGQIIDFLSRPLYGVGSVVDNAVDMFSGERPDNVGDWLKKLPNYAFVREMLFPEKRMTVSDAAFQNLPKPETALDGTGRFILGLGLDIAADPLTYVGAGAIKSVLGAGAKLPGVRGIVQGAQKGLKALPQQVPPPKVPSRADRAGTAFANELLEDAKSLPLMLEAGPIGRQMMSEGPRAAATTAKGLTDEILELPIGPKGALQRADEGLAARQAAANQQALKDPAVGFRVSREGVAEVSDNRAFIADLAGDISKGPVKARMLENVTSGETRPFMQSLLNLQKRTPVYPGVKIADAPPLFKEVPLKRPVSTVKVADGTPFNPHEALTALGIKSNPDGSALSFKSWLEMKRKGGGAINIDGTTVPVSQLINRVARLRETDAAAARVAHQYLTRAHRAYVTKVRDTTREVAAKASDDALRVVEASAESARETAEAIARQADRTRPVRLRGEELQKAKDWVFEHFSKQDAKEILGKKTPLEYEQAIKTKAQSKLSTPIYREIIVEAPVPRSVEETVAKLIAEGKDVGKKASKARTRKGKQTEKMLDDAKENITTASERIDQAVPGATRTQEALKVAEGVHVDPDTWASFMEAVGVEGAKWVSEPAAVKEAFNVTTQSAVFANLLKKGRVAMPENLKAPNASGYANYLGQSRWLLAEDGYNLIGKMRHLDEFARANGVEPILTQTRQGWPVSVADIMDVLWNDLGHTGRSFLERRVVSTIGISRPGQKGIQGRLNLTDLANVGRVMLDSIDPKWAKADDLESVVRQYLTRMAKDEDKILDALFGKQGVTKLVDGKAVPVSLDNAKIVLKEAMDTLYNERFVRGLMQRAHNNAAQSTVQIVDQVREVSSRTLDHLVETINNINASIGDSVRVFNTADTFARHAARTAKMHSVDETVKMSVKNVHDTIPEVVSKTDVDGITHLAKIETLVRNGDRAGIQAAQAKQHAKAVESALEGIPAHLADDAAHAADVAAQAGLLRMMMPIQAKAPGHVADAANALKRSFVSHYNNPTLHQAIEKGEGVMRVMVTGWRKQLNLVHHSVRTGKATSEDVAIAWKKLAGQSDIALDEKQMEIYRRLLPAVEQIFETRQGYAPGILGAFFREGTDVQHLISRMRSPIFGLKDDLIFDVKKATVNGKLDLESLANQWQSWKVDDPLDFMARMQTVAAKIQLDMSIANEGWRLANTLGYAGRSQRVGWVQFVGAGDSVIGKYLPKGAWYDPQILKEISAMDDILKQSDTFNSAFGRFVNQYIDPAQNMWKSGMTIWNPGHHTRNFYGDAALTFLATGRLSIKDYRNALRIMGHRRQYDGWDAIRALRGVNRTPAADGEVIVRSRNGLQLTTKQVFDGLMDRGALPTASVSDDLLEGLATPTIANMQSKLALTGGRARGFVGKVTESRDDLNRISHALTILRTGKFKNIEEALNYTARQVRKWHPDGLGLSPFERKYMRRIIPFYSWTRKTLPLIVESMVLNPGRVMVFPKASYNFGQAAGLDLQSLSVPFPEDQLFPSYMAEKAIGPQIIDGNGDYHGISPGIPSIDVLNDFVPNFNNEGGSDFLRSLLGGPVGMLSPLIKGPIEALTGTSMATGGGVHDLGEYLDSQIPQVSKISSIFGVSPIGTLGKAMPGGEPGVLDYRRAVEKDNRDPGFSIEHFLNWLLGISSQDMSTPSAVTQAEIELRNQLGNQRRRQQLGG